MKYKKVMQENIMDCGVACLLSVIRHYNGNNTMENIRYLTKCNKDGVNAYNLIDAAKKLGFDSYGIRCDLDYLLKDNIKYPCIAHTFNKGYKHYVIIEDMDNKNKLFIINDPAYGIRKYKYEDFINIWTNILIVLYPIRKLDNIKTQNIYRFYINIIGKHKKSFILIIFISLTSIFLTIINTYYFKLLIDNSNSIAKIYIVFLIVIFLKSIFDYFQNKIILNVSAKIDGTITQEVYNKLTSLPHYYFQCRQAGDIINRLNELTYVKDIISKIPIFIFVDLILLIVSTILLISINKMLFSIFILVVLIYSLVVLCFSKKNKEYIRRKQEEDSVVNSYMSESINGISTVKSLNIEDYVNRNFNKKYEELIRAKYSYEDSYNKESILKDLILFVGVNTILFLGTSYVNNKYISISDLVLFNSLILYFLEPLKNMFDLEPLIKNGINAIKRTIDIFSIQSDINEDCTQDSISSIEINNLSFSYNNIDLILKNISLNIKEKDKIIVVGNSGKGKSTLFRLLTKQYEVDDSKILINNMDINKWNDSVLRKNICYVSQDEKIFNDTLLNNITLGLSTSMKRLQRMCRFTHVNEILENKNIKLESYISENGTNLSTGEKQRIILLRSLLRDSSVLILDESLNGLDMHLEKSILKNILRICNSKILIYITHRVENINLFNKIINFNDEIIQIKERSKNGKIK